MEPSHPLIQPRSISFSLAACRVKLCQNRGSCVAPPGNSTDLVCDCDLGYQGEFCEGTINKALGLPLTISVLAIIVVPVIILFILARWKQKRKKRRSQSLAAKATLKVESSEEIQSSELESHKRKSGLL